MSEKPQPGVTSDRCARQSPHSVALVPIAVAAERRLVRLHMWAEFRRQITRVAGAAAFSAALRPIVWPLHHETPSHSARCVRSALCGGRRWSRQCVIVVRAVGGSRPALPTATRAIDTALGLAEVVASGVAFEKNGGDDEMASFAIDRARRAAEAIPAGNVSKLLVAEPVAQPRFFKLMIAVAFAGVLFGAIDRLVVERALHPVTASENGAADNLDKAAKKIAAEAKADPTKQELDAGRSRRCSPPPSAQSNARRAQGDREGAMEALEDMKKAWQRELDAQDRDRSKSLRDLRDTLESKGGTASEAADAMANDLASAKDQTEMDSLAAKMEKASAAAKATADEAERMAAAKSGMVARLRGAERRARRGRKGRQGGRQSSDGARAEGALVARALFSRHAGTSKLSAQASSLDRSLRAGAEGKQPGEGKDLSEGAGENGSKGSTATRAATRAARRATPRTRTAKAPAVLAAVAAPMTMCPSLRVSASS